MHVPMMEVVWQLSQHEAINVEVKPRAMWMTESTIHDHIWVSGPRGKLSCIWGDASLGELEIYPLEGDLEGDLFDDIERFKTPTECAARICKVLGVEHGQTEESNATDE